MSKIKESELSEYLKKFEGASIDDYKDDVASNHTKNNIDVVAGATVSSRAIIDAVIKSSALYDKIVRG